MPENTAGDDLLRAFLLDGFSLQELKALAYEIGGSELAAEVLVRASSRMEAVDDFVQALGRRGLVGRPLFDALARARPRRAHAVRSLQRTYVARKDDSHVAIVYANETQARAKELAGVLEQEGFRIWIDVDKISVGVSIVSEIEQGIRQAFAVIVIVGRGASDSVWLKRELALAAATREDKLIIPLLVGDVDFSDLPYGLRRYVGLRAPDRESFRLVAGRIVAALHQVRTTRAVGFVAEPSPVFDLALRFLRAAGRNPEPVEPSLFRIPEPVVLAATTPPTAFDVALLEGLVVQGEVAYFLYDGLLSESVSQQLDGMRIKGHPVVTVAADTMRAALQDGNVHAVFAEHTRIGTAGVNLFEATNAIVNPSLFFGRTELLNHVGGALGRGDAVLVTGVRKAGKSSFLHMLRQELSTRPVAWVDLQRLDRTDRRWPDRAFARIVDAWDHWGRDTWEDHWPFRADTKPIEKSAFIEAMEQRREHHAELRPDPGILVVLDEIERMMPSDGSAEEADSFERFAGALRSLAQEAGRCVTLLAADLRSEANRRNLLPNRRTNPWFNFFIETPLPPLRDVEVADMVRSLAARMGVAQVAEDFASALHAFTGGHAFLTRLVAAATWSERVRPDRIRLSDLSSGLRRLGDDATLHRFYAENLWAPLDAAEQRALIDLLPSSGWRAHLPPGLEDANARASLRAQGLVAERGIAIAGFAAWLEARSAEELHIRVPRAIA